MNTPAVQSSELSLSQGSFDHIQRVAKLFSESQLVPTVFQKNLPNVVVALEMSTRMGASPLMVMQNLNIIHGKPSWSSQFIIAAVNSCGRFHPLRYELTGTGDERGCICWTLEKDVSFPNDVRTLVKAHEANLPVLESPAITIAMAKKEGWFGKSGSKWQTMPDIMLRYRAATMFGRMYAPDILMGLKSEEEVVDIQAVEVEQRVEPVAIEQESKTTRRRSNKGVAGMEAELAKTAAEVAATPVSEAQASVSAATEAVPTATETPAETAPATAHVGSVSVLPTDDAPKALRCEVGEVTEKPITGGVVFAVELSGEYSGLAYWRGVKASIPAKGSVVDVKLKDQPNRNDPTKSVKLIESIEVVA